MRKHIRFTSSLVMILVCGIGLTGLAEDKAAEKTAPKVAAAPKIHDVFFAQQHVQKPTDPLFRMVGNLPALIKVQVYADAGQRSPYVVAVLHLGDKTKELTLRGPKVLPKPYEGKPELMPHSYEDSFTGIIPRDWVKPGLKVSLELRKYHYPHKDQPPYTTGVDVLDRKAVDTLTIGAPNKLMMTMFDIHFFKEEKGKDYPKGWEIAVQDKMPIAEINVQRVRPIVFDEMVMNPTNGKPALRVTSKEDFVKQSGWETFDGESAAAKNWMRALKRAGGYDPGHSVYFINVGYVPANGWGCHYTLTGMTDLGRLANFWHELGHVFSLPHWGQSKVYPHKGTTHGIPTRRPEVKDFPHVGPVWAYSLHRREFISPTVEEGSVGGTVGSWRGDPMQGGGYGDQSLDQMVKHFSDYSVNQMQLYMERKMLFWDDVRNGYYRWNEETKSFSTKVASDGWELPVNPLADVFSVMVAASAVTPRANFVYPVIGPYKAGLLNLYDATSAEDRKKAEAFGFSDTTSDLCIRVTQGGSTTTYLLKAKINPEANPLKSKSFLTTAVNLPVNRGKITKIDLLHTPNVVSKGLGADAMVLYSRTIHEKE